MSQRKDPERLRADLAEWLGPDLTAAARRARLSLLDTYQIVEFCSFDRARIAEHFAADFALSIVKAFSGTDVTRSRQRAEAEAVATIFPDRLNEIR